jgi:hypothetical protein
MVRRKASLRLFAGMQNVFVYSDYSGLDPEVAITGLIIQSTDNVLF